MTLRNFQVDHLNVKHRSLLEHLLLPLPTACDWFLTRSFARIKFQRGVHIVPMVYSCKLGVVTGRLVFLMDVANEAVIFNRLGHFMRNIRCPARRIRNSSKSANSYNDSPVTKYF